MEDGIRKGTEAWMTERLFKIPRAGLEEALVLLRSRQFILAKKYTPHLAPLTRI